ncbi:MAG: flagellar filament capping protein FliD, partial [Tumebacillaceae bacterium]
MSSPTRITGLVSGLDVDSLVKSLMTAKKIPIDQMKQKETQMEWKRDAYRDTNTLLSQLKDASLQMKLTSNTNRKTATTDNVNAVSATGTSTAVNGQYTLSVNTLATAASLTSAATLGLDATGNLNNATGSTLTVSGSKGTKDITIAANTTISQVVADLNAQSTVTGVKATYDKVADKLYLFSSDTGSTSNISLSESAGGTFLSQTKMPLGAVTNDDVVTATGAKSFTSTSSLIDNQLVGTKKVTVTSGATSVDLIINSSTTIANLQDQLSRSALGSNVNLSLDKSGKVRFESPAGTNLTFSNDMTELGLESTTTSNQNSVLARGTDATVQFNGSPDLITYHSNTFTLNGIQFNIKQPGATVNVTVGTDVDGVFNKIKGFIDTYNDILSKVTTKYNEPHDRSYLPLTDDQKSAMKDTDITKWEDVAKQGLLNGDQMLASAMSNMRQTMYSPVTAMSGQPISTLSDIGIQSFS